MHRAALFDEIEKIAKAQAPSYDPLRRPPDTQELPPSKPNPDWKREVARAVLLGGVGLATGYVAGEGLAHAFPSFFQNRPGEHQALRGKLVKNLILPTLGASALIVGDRFRRSMDEKLRQAPGWPNTERGQKTAPQEGSHGR